jgi:formate hydrogenlyase subunit 3/multisubunit Na+/H+ antiporter MnhD subunit
MASGAFTPILILLTSTGASTLAGLWSTRARNVIITCALGFSLSINTYFFILSVTGGFSYVKIGEFTINSASIFISELILLVAFFGVLYSFSYMEERNESWVYYLLYQIFIVMMIGMASSFNILVIYIFLEASSVTSAILVMFSRKRSSVLAAYRYLVLSIFGGILIVIGVFWQYQLTYSLDVNALNKISWENLSIISSIYILGFGIKAGLLPFGLLWLPPAHSEGPIPICSLLSAVLVQVAAFDIARILGRVGVSNPYISTMLLTVGLASMIVGSIYSLMEAWFGSKYTRFHVGTQSIMGIKRVWAFSTISEVGFVATFLGLAGFLASNMNSISDALALSLGGALLHICNHGLSKSLLFFDTGIIIKAAHTEDLMTINGLARKLPATKLTFTIGALSLSLIPGTLGITTLKELIFNSGIPDFVRIPVILSAGITLAACLSVWHRVFSSKTDVNPKPNVNIPRLMHLPGFSTSLMIIVLGLYFTFEYIGLIPESTAFKEVMHALSKSVISSMGED